jgi:hypothetical protein
MLAEIPASHYPPASSYQKRMISELEYGWKRRASVEKYGIGKEIRILTGSW